MAAGPVERRLARVRRLFLRLGMHSQLIRLEDGTTMHCWIPSPAAIQRAPLLLVHGFGFDGMSTWELQLEAFLQEYAVYVPDLVFFGDSTTTSPRRSEGFQAECLVGMLRQLGVDSGVNVVGTSYGGAITFQMASMYPALLHKVVIASAGVYMDAAEGAAVCQKANVDNMMKILLPTTIEELKVSLNFLLAHPPRLPNSTYEELLEVVHLKNRDSRIELYKEGTFGTDAALSRPTVTQEVLLIWGQNDRLFDIGQGLKLKKHLGNRAQLVIIEDTGHTPQSTDSRAFNNAVLAFLKDPSSRQSRL